MTFTKERNEEMEKVILLIDKGILPIENKDERTLRIEDVEYLPISEYCKIFNREFLNADDFNWWKKLDAQGEYVWCGEVRDVDAEAENPWDLHLTHTREKNRRAERRRQLHKHKKATVNGKTVKAYGKEGKFWLNNDERIAYGKQLINGKFVNDVKEAEKLAEVMADFAVDEEFEALMETKHYYDDYDAAMKQWEKECEVLEFFWDNADKFAEREIFGNYLPPCKLFERIDSLEWTKKFKDFLSLEEILDMFF